MRVQELLAEASIFTRADKYSYGHKVRAKGKLAQVLQQEIEDFNPNEDLEWIKSAARGAPVIEFGKGNTPRSFKRPDGTTFTVLGTDSAIQGSLNHAPGQKGSVEGNVGDLSEPVLSAAVVAKLIKRGADSIGDIDEQNVIDTLNAAINSGDSSYTVRDRNSKIADTIKFTVAVREPTKAFMQRPDFWDMYRKMLPSAVHYANSGQIDRYADYFYKNGKVDSVYIRSDGMSDQKGKKTDIEAFVRDEQTGEMRALKNLKISLKAGSSQFGQQGAGTVTADPLSPKGIYQSSVNFFSPLGVNLAPPARAPKDKISWWKKAYIQAARQLKDFLRGEDARTEAGVISKIASMISYHATKGDETVRLVQLGKSGISTVHSFRGLVQKLIDQNIDLDVSYREGQSKNGEPRPEISIFDRNSKKVLIKIGYHATADNKKIWNAITMEPLLSELTSMIRPKKT